MSPLLGNRSSEISELSLEKLYALVSNLKDSILNLETENYIFETYLQRMEPSTLINWQASADNLNFQMRLAQSRKSVISTGSSLKSTQSKFSLKLSTQYKIEMADKELYTIQQDGQLITRNYSQKKILFTTKLEELHERIVQYKNFKEDLENIINANKSKTRRIPGEKLILHISKNLEMVDAFILKLRLQRGNLFKKLRDVSTILIKKLETVENGTSPIDIECLKLININLRKKLSNSDLRLYNARMFTAEAKLNLSLRKHFHDFQCKQLQQIKTEVNNRKLKQKNLKNLMKYIESELKLMRHKIEETLNLQCRFSAPTVESYMYAKDELTELKNQIEAWNRKEHVQLVEIKKLTNKLKLQTQLFASKNFNTWKKRMMYRKKKV